MEVASAHSGQPGEDGLANSAVAKLVRNSGQAVAWLTLLMVLLTFTIVILRYGFNLGWIWLQESVIYLHATVFMLAAAWGFQIDEHVRVDIFYRTKSARHKAWVNLIGSIVFLLPMCIFILITGWDYVSASWSALEGSREAGGLPLIYLLKSLILLLPALLLLQAFVTIKSCIATLRTGH